MPPRFNETLVTFFLVLACLLSLSGRADRTEQDDIKVEIKPYVRKFVNEEIVQSLRARIRRVVAEDEIDQVNVVIGFCGPRLQVTAIVKMPTLTSGTYMVDRKILLSVSDWRKRPAGAPVKKGKDHEWSMERTFDVKRIVKVGDKVCRVMICDAISYDELQDLLDMIGRKGLVFSEEIDQDRVPSLPEVDEIWTIEKRGDREYEIRVRIENLETRGTRYLCRKNGDKLVVCEAGWWIR